MASWVGSSVLSSSLRRSCPISAFPTGAYIPSLRSTHLLSHLSAAPSLPSLCCSFPSSLAAHKLGIPFLDHAPSASNKYLSPSPLYSLNSRPCFLPANLSFLSDFLSSEHQLIQYILIRPWRQECSSGCTGPPSCSAGSTRRTGSQLSSTGPVRRRTGPLRRSIRPLSRRARPMSQGRL